MSYLSVTGRKWVYKEYNNEDVDFFKNNLFLDEITSKLLAIKKISKNEAKSFLNPSIKNLIPNPSILKDMDKATDRIVRSIQNNDKIAIFGDYDVDGATSSALLGNFFNQINQSFEIFIPDRQKDGYGPSINSFKNLIKNGCKLILTVDCGTLSYEPIKYAAEQKIDILVFDHHQSETNLPKAYAIVNPNRYDDNSNLNYLCAAGVCFMFLISLNRKLRKINYFKDKNLVEPDLIDFLDLVSLGTVCDVVPLTNLNRAIVKQGLKVMRLKKNVGLKMLFDICKIETKPTTYHMGYVLGPRINAGGRVGKCSHGANLLLISDIKNAFKIASDLDSYNKERQELEKKLLNEILSNLKEISDPVIVLSGKNWHEGIIGIIASRIKEKFKKPTIIISINNEGMCKASARSVYGYDMGSLIISAVNNGIIQKGGGHKMAAGFSIKEENIETLKKFAVKKFKNSNIDSNYENKLFIDTLLYPSAINLEFFNKVDSLSPFGSGNVEPKFSVENVRSIQSKIVGEKHIKSILICKDGSTINAIAFNAKDSNIGPYLDKNNKKIFNIVGKLSLNEWKGEKKVEFIIDDISVNKTFKNTVPSSIG